MSPDKFKQCPKCGVWLSLEDILSGPDVITIGMSLDSEDFTFNHYYFNHVVEGCNTTFAMSVMDFREFINEPIADDIMTGKPGCEQHCNSLTDTRLCGMKCRWAPFRRFMDEMMRRKMNKSNAPAKFDL